MPENDTYGYLSPRIICYQKNWEIFATRRRISLIINTDYFRGGEVMPPGKTIINNMQMRAAQ